MGALGSQGPMQLYWMHWVNATSEKKVSAVSSLQIVSNGVLLARSPGLEMLLFKETDTFMQTSNHLVFPRID